MFVHLTSSIDPKNGLNRRRVYGVLKHSMSVLFYEIDPCTNVSTGFVKLLTVIENSFFVVS